jgi:hypothetical protein
MTQDEVLETLHRVVQENKHYTTWTVSTPHLVALVNLAIEHEREACAKVCEVIAQKMEDEGEGPTGNIGWVDDCAKDIRARGQA